MPGKKNKKENKFLKNYEELKNQLARALADYDNLKKRTEAEKEGWFKFSSARIVQKFLPILNMLRDAQKHIEDQGLSIVLGEFQRTIDEEGFREIEIRPGETDFDSLKMEAVETVESKDKEKQGKVAEVVLTGWQSKNEEDEKFVIRPAKVKV